MKRHEVTMGIRCECPKGHRLHVKDVLAGKRGKCPECGETFVIPAASSPQPAANGAGRPAAAGAEQPPTDAPNPDTASVVIPVAQSPASPASTAAAPESPSPAKPSPARAIPKAKPKPSAVAEATPASESQAAATEEPPPPTMPAAEWYARPPGGGQLGPATDAELREWLASGQVTADSYVWRTGWEDWRRVDQATADLPQAPPPTPPTPPTAAPTVAPNIAAPAAQPKGPSAAERYAQKRRSARKRRSITAVLLGCLAVGLGGVLVWVLLINPGGSSENDTAGGNAPAAAAKPPADAATDEADDPDAGDLDQR